MKTVVTLATFVIVIGGLVAVVRGVIQRSPRVHQPIQFNHVIHLEEAGLACTECHTGAATSSYAGIPGKAVCLDCHDVDEEANTNPEKDKLFSYGDGDGEIPWRRVAVTRPDVFFSHRRHVTSAKLDCLACHKDQKSLAVPPPSARLVMRMVDCIECHDKSGASHDCVACHR